VFFDSDHAIERIAAGLGARTLPKKEWTHAAHWAAAFWLLSRHGDAAQQQMPGLIRAYNEAVGVANTDTGGYHETITQASLRAARAWLAAHAGQPLHEALETFLGTGYGRPDWLLAYWSRPRLFCVEARRTWVEPDLQPLPFP
jgi:hypothetical protein